MKTIIQNLTRQTKREIIINKLMHSEGENQKGKAAIQSQLYQPLFKDSPETSVTLEGLMPAPG